MASELKPCAHCDGAAELDYQQPFCAFPSGKMEKQVAIYCTECDVHMSMCYSDFPEYNHDQMAAILTEKWNTRPTPVAPVSPDATGKCGELVTVAWESMDNKCDPDDKLVYEIKFPRNGDKRLVYRSQAVELLAERDETIRRQDIALRGALREVKRLKADNAAKDARVKELETEVAEATRRGEDQWAGWVKEEALRKALEAKLAAAEKALEFYAKQVSGCRKIGSDGDKFRAS
ncbi:hypothetical protein CN880_21510, partial [Ochrobactrum sp. 720/2009]